jgi:hypothetical protein
LRDPLCNKCPIKTLRSLFLGAERGEHIFCILPLPFDNMNKRAMTGTGAAVRLFHAVYDACSQRIEMDMPDEFQKVRVFLA